jgi:hypothetical protein
MQAMKANAQRERTSLLTAAIAIAIAVAVASGLLLLSLLDPRTSTGAAEEITKPMADAPEIQNRPRLLQSHPDNPPRANPEEITACQQFVEAMLSLKLRELRAHTKLPVKLPATDCPAVRWGKAFSRWHHAYEEACFNRVPAWAATNPLAADDCYMAAKAYRVILVEQKTRDVPLRTISDPATLVDKLTARFMLSPASSIEVAERLLELKPQMYSAKKAVVVAKLRVAMEADGDAERDQRWDEVSRAVAELRNNGNPSAIEKEQLDRMDVAVSLERDGASETTREQIAAYAKANPDGGWGPYFNAWAESKAGNREAAVSMLAESVRREPDNPVFRATNQLVSSPPLAALV